MRLALLLLALATAGCAATPPMYEPSTVPSAPSLTAYSSGSFSSASESFTSSPSAPSVPQRGATSDLVVRPDMLEMGFALRETEMSEAQAIAAAQATVAAIAKELEQVTQGAAKVKMCGMTATPMRLSYSKAATKKAEAADDEKAPGEKAPEKVKMIAVTVDGLVEVPLAASLDYWGRMRLISALKQVTREVVARAAAVPEGRRGATFADPRPLVKDPEGHRAALTERWVRRVRSFTEVAQGGAAPLQVVDCTPPGPIEQQVRSLEEVALSLNIACRLNVAAGRQGGGRE
ncbi:hypothetical protein [Chondromyces apiculatus]|uniref:Lipoprotein n=1 Tax=Chondromyces apiculatus DSM 436 TaxID=1192034 RepID=A0A017T196_9BACT|nr:hypothetical protein [Chondromyces apiculatus]EYF02993.1 Hypothetical protein CAP_6255 [Chondromyces apiculatus DSM 436]